MFKKKKVEMGKGLVKEYRKNPPLMEDENLVEEYFAERRYYGRGKKQQTTKTRKRDLLDKDIDQRYVP